MVLASQLKVGISSAGTKHKGGSVQRGSRHSILMTSEPEQMQKGVSMKTLSKSCASHRSFFSKNLQFRGRLFSQKSSDHYRDSSSVHEAYLDKDPRKTCTQVADSAGSSYLLLLRLEAIANNPIWFNIWKTRKQWSYQTMLGASSDKQ